MFRSFDPDDLFAYNPASQIVSETRSNDAYAQVLSNQITVTVHSIRSRPRLPTS
jgi:hypothetical protein